MLEVQNLTLHRENSLLLDHVSFTAEAGKVLGLVSMNPEETTSLLECLYGNLVPGSGRIVFNNLPLGFPRKARTNRALYLAMGGRNVFPNLSVLHNLCLANPSSARLKPLDEVKLLLEARPYLERLAFGDSLHHSASSLTPEDTLKVAVVQALCSPAECLLLARMTTHLRLETVRALFQILRQQAQSGRLVLFVPDNPNQIFEVCDEVMVLRNGAVVFQRPVNDVDIEEIYNSLNNTEYSIHQAIENKFHQMQMTIDDLQVLLERMLKLLGNFCGISNALFVCLEKDQPRLIHSRYWPRNLEHLTEAKAIALLRSLAPDQNEATVRWQKESWSLFHYGTQEGLRVLLLVEKPFNEAFPFRHLIDQFRTALEHLSRKLELRRQEKQREINAIKLENELDIARSIQKSILPKTAQLKGYEIAAYMATATEVGGDVYEIYPTEVGNFIGIGDVSGHGLSSGLTALIEMAALHGVIQTILKYSLQPSPHKIYDILNMVLCVLNRDRIGSDKFMTKILMIENEGNFFFAGTHEVGLIYRASENRVYELEEMINRTAFLGLTERLDSSSSLGSFTLNRGDLLLLYTDGLIEAMNEHNEQFDLVRVKSIIEKCHDLHPSKILENLVKAVHDWAKNGDLLRHGGRLADDLTLVLIKRQ